MSEALEVSLLPPNRHNFKTINDKCAVSHQLKFSLERGGGTIFENFPRIRLHALAHEVRAEN